MRVKKKAVREIVRNYLFEYGASSLSNVNYGIYDRPGPSWDEEKLEDKDTTVPAEVPLTPTEMMSSQLVDERPPIEDDEYTPSNPEELSRAFRECSPPSAPSADGKALRVVIALQER